MAEAPGAGNAWLAAARRGGASTEEALSRFDALAPTPLAQMRGLWKGSGLRTGHRLDGVLERFGWYGKRFDDAETVYPLLFGKDPTRLRAVDPARLPLGLALRLDLDSALMSAGFRLARPFLTTCKPGARLRLIEHRGVMSAAMIYDAQPIIDIFRRVDERTMLGLMDMRGMEQPFFFLLERVDG